MPLHAVTVFCASKNGNDPLYAAHAAALGALLATERIKVIYGGGNKGLMGQVANAVLNNKGEVIGVIPELLLEWEQYHTGLTELITVPDMHSRKKLLYEMGDAGIVLPGGFGTLDELFEMLTWNQLKIHDKRLYLLNSGGFYTHLGAHLEKMEQEGLLYYPLSHRISICDSPGSLLEELRKA